MSKVRVTGYLQVPEDELASVLAGLGQHIELSRQEAGCLTFDIQQDDANPCRLNLYEEYQDQAAFEAHKQRAGNSAWASVSKNVERFLDVAEIN